MWAEGRGFYVRKLACSLFKQIVSEHLQARHCAGPGTAKGDKPGTSSPWGQTCVSEQETEKDPTPTSIHHDQCYVRGIVGTGENSQEGCLTCLEWEKEPGMVSGNKR